MIFRKKKKKEENQLTDIISVIDDDLYDIEKPEKYKVITMEESKIMREESGLIGRQTKVSIKKLKKKKRNNQ